MFVSGTVVGGNACSLGADSRAGWWIVNKVCTCKGKQGKRAPKAGEIFATLKQVVEEGLTKELMSEQRSEGKEGGNCVYISMKCIPGRGDSQCKGPGVGWSWLPMQPCLGL